MNLFVKVIVHQKQESQKAGNVHPNDVIYLPITSISYLRNSGSGRIDVFTRPDVKINVGFPDYYLTTTKDDIGMDNP